MFTISLYPTCSSLTVINNFNQMNKGFVVTLALIYIVSITYAQVESRGLGVQKWDDDAQYNGD